MGLKVIILAAGGGTRMRSALPKVLHPLAGVPLLEHVVTTAFALNPERVHIVYGHGGEQVRTRLDEIDVEWVEQSEQLGTGHAVQQVMPKLRPGDTVLVLYGDVPLIEAQTLQRLLAAAAAGGLALITAQLPDPAGYGRIVRDAAGVVRQIIEEKDASAEQRAIREINTGFLAANAGALQRWLAGLGNDNVQGEYYLTDVIARAVADGIAVQTVGPRVNEEILGVNNRLQLATLERWHQRRQAERLLLQGVTLLDPERFDLRGELSVGRDVVIDVGVVLSGRVRLGDNVVIGPYSVINESSVGAGARIESHCVIDHAEIGPDCRVGPFARLRPGAVLKNEVHVGNFVEVKNSEIGVGSKANHLTYIGDTTVGRGVNVGAGTITANYDGANKHRTTIEDDASIGSNVVLRAPVTVGKGATIGAGSVITKDAPPGELTVARARQETRRGWKRPVKITKRDE